MQTTENAISLRSQLNKSYFCNHNSCKRKNEQKHSDSRDNTGNICKKRRQILHYSIGKHRHKKSPSVFNNLQMCCFPPMRQILIKACRRQQGQWEKQNCQKGSWWDTAQAVQALGALSWARQKDPCLANSEHGHGNGVFYT